MRKCHAANWPFHVVNDEQASVASQALFSLLMLMCHIGILQLACVHLGKDRPLFRHTSRKCTERAVTGSCLVYGTSHRAVKFVYFARSFVAAGSFVKFVCPAACLHVGSL